MSKKSIEIELNLKDQQFKRAIKGVRSEVEDTEEALDDTKTAAQALADAMQSEADAMIQEIDATKAAVEALERALGPDFDADTTAVVSDLKRVGLTAEEIEADADQLASAIRRVDDVKLHAAQAGFDNLDQAVGRVSDGQDRARGATNSFVGNAIAELPGVSSAFGPAGEAVSQLTEGLLEGEVGFQDLAKAGLAMGGVGALVMVVSKALGSMAETKAFNKKQVEDWRDAIADANSDVEAVSEFLNNPDNWKIREEGWNEFQDRTEDVRDEMQRLGLDVEGVHEILNSPEPQKYIDQLIGMKEETDKYSEMTQGASEKNKDLDRVIEFLTQQLENQSKAYEDVNLNKELGIGVTEDATEATEEEADATEEATQAMEDHIARMEESAERLQENAEATLDMVDAQRSAADATFALHDAEDDFLETLEEVSDEVADGGGDLRKLRQSMDKAAESAADLADAEVRVAEETANANGKTLTATERQDIFNDSLLASAATASGPARKGIMDYIAYVNDIPAEKMTEIEAAIDKGDIDEANRLIDDASRTRTATIKADADAAAAESTLNWLARPRTSTVKVNTAGGMRFAATGSGGTHAGSYMVGEQGPELVNLPRGSQVLNAPDTRRAMAGRGGTTNVYMNFPNGTRPADVVAAQRKWERRNGPT